MRSRGSRNVHLKTSPEQLRAAGVLLNHCPAAGLLGLATVFGNARPVEIEIGPGKGAFLLRRAAERPEINLLGIEWVGAYAAYSADRARRAGLENVRLLCADAQQVVERQLADVSIWCVHIYFPDPWPKRKHLRRRLIKPQFIMQLCRVLQPGGTVRIVTDHADYFRQIRWALATVHGLAPVPFNYGSEGRLVGSNFERKYVAHGRRLYEVAVIRYA